MPPDLARYAFPTLAEPLTPWWWPPPVSTATRHQYWPPGRRSTNSYSRLRLSV